MAQRALVEPVDLELEPVQAEVEQQVALKELRRLVGKTAAAKIRMNREISEVRNPRAAVNELEAHRAGASPVGVLLDLDHEAAECVWLPLRTLDLQDARLGAPIAVARSAQAHAQHSAAIGNQVEAGPLDGQRHGVAGGEAGKAGWHEVHRDHLQAPRRLLHVRHEAN